MLLVFPVVPITDRLSGLECPVISYNASAGSDPHKRARRNARDVTIGSEMTLREKSQPLGKIFLGEFRFVFAKQHQRFEDRRPCRAAVFQRVKERTGSREVSGQDQFAF